MTQEEQTKNVQSTEKAKDLVYWTEKTKGWFVDRRLDTLKKNKGQLSKMQEEVDELKEAFFTNNREEEIDAVGDILVTVIGYAMQNDLDLTDCLESAYNEIKDRKGYVNDEGVFVKEQ